MRPKDPWPDMTPDEQAAYIDSEASRIYRRLEKRAIAAAKRSEKKADADPAEDVAFRVLIRIREKCR